MQIYLSPLSGLLLRQLPWQKETLVGATDCSVSFMYRAHRYISSLNFSLSSCQIKWFMNGTVLVMLPFWISGIGILASIGGYYVVGTKDGASQKELLIALHKGLLVTSMIIVVVSAIVIPIFFQGRRHDGWSIYACIVIGLFAGALVGQITEYFTSYSYWPTQSIAKAGVTGPGTVVIQGLGVGMISTIFPALVLVITILACNELYSAYGVAMASVGMLSTLSFTLATDAYGAIADNAGGIAEMAKMDARVRKVTDSLDALGNTTAATGKGFAIGSAVGTSLSLLAAFKDKAGIENVDVGNAIVLSGILVGAMLPFLFAGLTMLSVQKVSFEGFSSMMNTNMKHCCFSSHMSCSDCWCYNNRSPTAV